MLGNCAEWYRIPTRIMTERMETTMRYQLAMASMGPWSSGVTTARRGPLVLILQKGAMRSELLDM